jgi:hypothetical protein
MSTLRAHMAMLRTLAKQDPATTMLMLAMIGAMEEMAEAIDGLRGRVAPPE